jgi:hypothetical protein
MDKHPPKRVALDPDNHHARHVGRAADGTQFFLTTPFVPAIAGDPGQEFLALYRFDDAGTLLDARIEDCGPRAGLDEVRRTALTKEMLASLGEVTPGRIRVAPFHVERFGIEFGFISSPPDDPDDDWVVSVMPGEYMAFIAPWDSGEYET